MMQLEETLRAHAFTRGLTAPQLAGLSSLACEVGFDENDVILVDGQRSRSFYLLLEGSVAIELNAARYSVTVQAPGPGDAFGWSSLLDDQDTLFQVRARERTRALRLDSGRLKALCRTDPALGAEILRRALRLAAARVRATETRFAEMCGVRV